MIVLTLVSQKTTAFSAGIVRDLSVKDLKWDAASVNCIPLQSYCKRSMHCEKCTSNQIFICRKGRMLLEKVCYVGT